MEQNNEYFVISEENGILVLTMQAPGNNLMTDEFFRQYEELMTEISKKKKLKGLIIKGSARHFSVGADVGSLAERSSTESETMNGDYDFSQGHVKQKKLVTFLYIKSNLKKLQNSLQVTVEQFTSKEEKKNSFHYSFPSFEYYKLRSNL